VEEVGLVQLDPVLEAGEVLVTRRPGPDESDDVVPLAQQELGQ